MRALLAAALIVLAQPTHALDIKGVRPGMTYDEFIAHAGPLLLCPREQVPYFSCKYDFTHRNQSIIDIFATVAEVPVRLWLFEFVNGQLYSAGFNIPATEFPAFVAALTAKHGKPTISRDTVQNRMGAKFMQEHYAWEDKETRISATKYAEELDRSLIAIFHKGLSKVRTEQLKAETEKRKKDL